MFFHASASARSASRHARTEDPKHVAAALWGFHMRCRHRFCLSELLSCVCLRPTAAGCFREPVRFRVVEAKVLVFSPNVVAFTGMVRVGGTQAHAHTHTHTHTHTPHHTHHTNAHTTQTHTVSHTQTHTQLHTQQHAHI